MEPTPQMQVCSCVPPYTKCLAVSDYFILLLWLILRFTQKKMMKWDDCLTKQYQQQNRALSKSESKSML